MTCSTDQAYGCTTRARQHGVTVLPQRIRDTGARSIHVSTACSRHHGASLHGAGVRLHDATMASRCRHGCTTRARCLLPWSRHSVSTAPRLHGVNGSTASPRLQGCMTRTRCLHPGAGVRLHNATKAARCRHGCCTTRARQHSITTASPRLYSYTTRARCLPLAQCLHGGSTASPRLHGCKRVHGACLHGAGVQLHNMTKAARCRHGCTTRSRLHGVTVLTASRCLPPRSRRMAARRVYIVR